MKYRVLILLALGVVFAISGCGSAAPPVTAVPTQAQIVVQVVATSEPPPPTSVPSPAVTPTSSSTPQPLTIAVLKNAEYQNEFVTGGKAKLTEGSYKETTAVGAATQVQLQLLDTAAFGDLNGDGVDDAVVILNAAPSGDGSFFYLVAMLNRNGVPQQAASFLLGDRVQVKGIKLENGEIVVNMVAHGTRDPICCPTLAVARRYKFTENKLVALLAQSPAPTETAASPQTTQTPRPRATATTALKPPAPKGFIAYHFVDQGIDRVAMINLETKQILPLFDVGPVLDLTENTGASMLAWSPDNSKIAYIATVSLGGSNSLKLYDARLNETVGVFSSDAGGGLSSPTWSPDGSQIAFVRWTGNRQNWAINYVNANRTPCANGVQMCLVRTSAPEEQFRGGLDWSSAGVFALGMNTTKDTDVFTLNLDGSELRNLTNHAEDDNAPAWSPDGKLIAFTSRRDGREQIYLMNADGSGLRRVSQSTDRDSSPSWSPDGNWIAFSSFRGGQTDIYLMDTRGGNVTRLSSKGADRPKWSR